ncbi:hypothetical protein [Thiocystis violacea]|uniref:hypothetical protein n=1 Tax=Thiocystis violacea TaxID=13725 RepID=UPI001907DD82|nr:hypothetical protein [Thiocystis violacea]MBK1717851.1 hypothetical protein [Thiocystis violacea]
MTAFRDEFQRSPLACFRANGVFTQAFDALRDALDEQQRAVGEQPTPWLTRYGKGGPDYPEYRSVCLAQHCLDVGFIAALILVIQWCRGDLRDHGIGPDDEAAMVALLKRLLALAMAHDGDKYVGGKSRSPDETDVAAVYRELNIETWTGMSLKTLQALVDRIERRGLSAAVLHGRISGADGLIADAVHLADNALSKAARAEAEQTADPDQAFLDALRIGLKNNLRLDLGRWEMRRFRHNPAVLYWLRDALLDKIADQCGFPPWVLTLNGDELAVSIPADLDLRDVGYALLERLDEPYATFRVNPNDGYTNLQDVADPEDLLEALHNGDRHGLLLRIARTDISAALPWLVQWIAQHGVLAINETPTGESLLQVLNFRTFQADDWSCPVTRALGIAMVLKAGVRSPNKELPVRFELLMQALEQRNLKSLEALEADWTERNPHTRISQAALQVAADLDDPGDFEALLANVMHGAFGDRYAHRPDPGSTWIVADLLRQVGLETDDQVVSTPYASHPKGGTCLACSQPTQDIYKATESTVPGIKGTAFSNRIGHVKDIFSEKAGTTYICPACVKGLGLLGNLMQSAGRPLVLKDENLVNVGFSIQSRILPTAAARTHGLQLLGKDRFGTKRLEQRLNLTPWHVNYSDTAVLYVERVKDGLAEAIDLHLRTAETAMWNGNAVQLFRGRQHVTRGIYYSELVPPVVAALIQDLTLPDQPACTIAPGCLDALVQRLDILNDLIRRKDNNKLTVINDLAWAGWWPLAWMRLLNPEDRFFTDERLRRAKQEFPMTEDTLLGQLGSYAANIQRMPWGGIRASGNLLGLSFDTALDVFMESLAGDREEADGMAAIQRRLYDYLYRRGELQDYGHPRDLDARCQTFARCAWEVFRRHAQEDGDLSGKTRRYLRAAYISYFLEAAEAKQAARKDDSNPKTTPLTEAADND